MRIAALIALLAFLAPAGPARAQKSGADKAARAHYEKGAKHFLAGRFDEALLEYRAAYELAPRPALLFNIARALDAKGDKEAALEHYRKYLDVQPEGGASDEARDFAAAIERELAAARPPPAPEPSAPEPSAPRPPPPEPAGPPADPSTVSFSSSSSPETSYVHEAPASSPARPRFEYGPRLGLSVADVTLETWEGPPRVGFAAGGFLRWAPDARFALRPELLYVQRGSGYSGADSGHFDDWHTDHLELALLGELAIRMVRLAAGPYAAVVVVDNSPYDGDSDYLETFDLGLTAGAGVELPLGPGSLLIEARYEHGLTELIDDDAHTFHRGLLVTAGYAFR